MGTSGAGTAARSSSSHRPRRAAGGADGRARTQGACPSDRGGGKKRIPALRPSDIRELSVALARPDLAETVEAILKETGFGGAPLTLDITETVYVRRWRAHSGLDHLRG